jgi:DNA-binding transcriptional ArsR family regulator
MEEFSWKANQNANTRLKILYAFTAKNDEIKDRTWSELKKLSGLSNGALSKHLPVLFEEGYVKGEVRAVNHKLVTFYMLAHPEFGATYSLQEDDGMVIKLAFHKDDKGRKILVKAHTGVLRRTGKSKEKRFRPT